MSPFGAVNRNRGSRNPLAYNSILNPGGTLSFALGGRVTTCARLIVKAFELGGGKSCTVILRVTLGASLVQSPIAVLPVRTGPFSAAAAIMTPLTKTVAKKIARKIGSLNRQAFISRESFGRQISRGFDSSGAKVSFTTGLSLLFFSRLGRLKTHEQKNACCPSLASGRTVGVSRTQHSRAGARVGAR